MLIIRKSNQDFVKKYILHCSLLPQNPLIFLVSFNDDYMSPFLLHEYLQMKMYILHSLTHITTLCSMDAVYITLCTRVHPFRIFFIFVISHPEAK